MREISFNGYTFSINEAIWSFDEISGPNTGLSGEEFTATFVNIEYGYELNLLIGESEPRISNAYQPILYSVNEIDSIRYEDDLDIPGVFLFCNEDMGYSYSCKLLTEKAKENIITEWYGTLLGYDGANMSITSSVKFENGFRVDDLADAVDLINEIYAAKK